VVFFEAGGAEDGDAGADEVEAAEAVEEVANDFEEEAEFFEAAVGAADEVAVIDFAAVGLFGVFVFGGGGEGRREEGRHRERGCELGESAPNEAQRFLR
jgi:hypothetical protein